MTCLCMYIAVIPLCSVDNALNASEPFVAMQDLQTSEGLPEIQRWDEGSKEIVAEMLTIGAVY